jgi:chromate reductase
MSTKAQRNAPCRILLISGSLRAGSTHTAVLETALRVAPPHITATVYAGLAGLPHFNPDEEAQRLPSAAAQLRSLLRESDAVLFSTPEYAGSLPGSFKNLLDWTVGEGLYRKPVGFINTSPHGAAQGAIATLRTVLGYVSADVVEAACQQLPVRRDAVGPDGIIVDPELQRQIAALLTLLAQHCATRTAC